MEDVLEVYHRPYGDNEVLVCLDETSKQQTKETRLPRPARPGASGVYDYEYERNGSNLFMLFAPLEGWRQVEVTDRRTKVDWAGWSGSWWTRTTRTKTGSRDSPSASLRSGWRFNTPRLGCRSGVDALGLIA